MNQARSGKYYAEDFDARRPIPWMAILGAVVVVAIFCTAALFVGDHLGFARGRAFQADLAKPTCPAPVPAPELSRNECISACFSKERMSRVKPRQG